MVVSNIRSIDKRKALMIEEEGAQLSLRAGDYAELLDMVSFDGIYELKSSIKDKLLNQLVHKDKANKVKINLGQKRNLKTEALLNLAIKQAIEDAIYEERAIQKILIRKVFYAFSFGIGFMFLLFMSEQMLTNAIGNKMVIEGFKVFGWMYMWQAFQTLGFDCIEVSKKLRKYSSVQTIRVEFCYQ